MARTRIVLNQRNIDKLPTLPKVVADTARRTKAIEDACNSQSSWGGYRSEVEVYDDGPHGRVWSIDEASDEARAQRLVRNLDAAR
jgi:hypothetical protein